MDNKDIRKIMDVFHKAIKEIVDKETIQERMSVISEWIELMGHIDKAMGGMIYEKDKASRVEMLRDFEEKLKEFDFVEER